MKEFLPAKRLFAAASVAAIVIGFAGCALKPQNAKPESASTRQSSDIQERLSAVITRDGFGHEIRSQRDSERHVDFIYIRVPLDSLKRRHYSLDNLMKDVGRVCSLPEFAQVPVRVEIGTGDEQDRMYLKNILVLAISGKRNIEVSIETAPYNDILITAVHPHGTDY